MSKNISNQIKIFTINFKDIPNHYNTTDKILNIIKKRFPNIIVTGIVIPKNKKESHINKLFKNIKLTKKEILFLDILLKNKNNVVTYTEIENYVWGEKYMTKYAIRSLVKKLRKKIPNQSIKNLSGVGYKLII